MDWDYTFFIQQNNPFRKHWFTNDREEAMMLIVTEVNRGMLCTSCQRQIGEVATMFYEIDGKNYCSKCGFELMRTKGRVDTGQKPEAPSIAAT